MCFAFSRVMIGLKLVESAGKENAHAQDDDELLSHGFNVFIF